VTTELTEEQEAEIAAEVDALQADWNDAWEVVDVERAMSHWTESPETGWAIRGMAFLGAEELAQVAAGSASYYEGITRQENTRRESRTHVLAPDVVYIMERGASITIDTAGVAGPETDYAYTYVWIQQNGEWKIHFAHGSLPVPLPQ
jgi:ketosteroid isomerase-like protein